MPESPWDINLDSSLSSSSHLRGTFVFTPSVSSNGKQLCHKLHRVETYFVKRFYLFIFRKRGREGEREGEKHQCVVASRTSPTGDLARNPGLGPDWESNWRPFGLQAGTRSTEPQQLGSQFNF